MRNVFLCLLTVMLFAPDATFAAGSSRLTSKNDNGVDTVRAASSVKTGAGRTNANRSDNGNTRSEKSISRNKDITSRTTTVRAADGASRNINNSSVVSRTSEKVRSGVNVRSRNHAGQMSFIQQTRSDNTERNVANRAATTNKEKKVTAQDVSDAKELLEQTANLNKSCQEQYNECMDQFCAVVDSNQKRCSCSANLSKYSNVQDAVNNANNQLNQVAQRIRYVGLSADEIRAIMTETEAEAELDDTKDTSETRSMLSKIETLIKDPTTSVTTMGDTDFGLDLNLDFSDDSADLFSLDFLNGESDSISSKRGTALYNAAKKRCKTILNNCTDVGATSTQITGNYDLAIDKDCIAYEQGLKKMNETLQSNVRSAVLMLQKARLAVLQNKNQYDAKGCVSALESCMTDDMVCGSDYAKCLDPTKKYIDENGKVVLGQDITNITDFMSGFNNAAIDNMKLSTAATVAINETACKNSDNNDGTCVIKYLLNKIGTGATVKNGGLCRAVLDKCQQYTYNLSGDKYNPYNDVVINFIQRAMVNIKSAQQQIISNYASTCMTEVASCYNQQVTQVNSWSSVASVSSIKGVMTGACRNVALTCAYAVFANMCAADASNIKNWVLQDSDVASNTSCIPCNPENQSACIEGISEIFYQSLLCPDNSTYNSSCITGGSTNRTIEGCVNTQCSCNSGYTVWSGSCVPSCSSSDYRNEMGSCVACGTDCDESLKDTSGNSNNNSNNTQTCPANSTAVPTSTCSAPDTDGTVEGCVSQGCQCDSGYSVNNGDCVSSGGE